MIDFVKLVVTDSPMIATLLRNTICTKIEVDHTTGEFISEKYVGHFRDLDIVVYASDRILISGSLNKYFEGGTNCGDFTLRDFRQTVYSLCSLLGLDPCAVKLENVEFGVNVKLGCSPQNVLGSIVSLQNGKPFVPQVGEGLKCCLKEFRYKIYNKSKQYKFNRDNLLRFELHIDKMRKIFPVKTLHDLTKAEVWEMLGKELVAHLRHIVFVDEYDLDTMTKPERKYFYAFENKINNIRFWKEQKPLERHRHRKRLDRLQGKAKFQWNKVLTQLVAEKLTELINVQ